MPHRIYRREPVIEGSWQLSVTCRKCANPIYSFDAQSSTSAGLAVLGDSDYLIPCRNCGHDDTYSGKEFKCLQAKAQSATYPERPQPSNSPRKPLLTSYPDARAVMGVGYIEDRPKAAALVGRIVTSWADVEVQSTRLLAELMGANIPQVAAVFSSLRNSRSQSDALLAAAEVVLDEKDLLLLKAHLARKSTLEKERNDLAHGCFGVSVAIPEHIIWCSQTDFIKFAAATKFGQEFDLCTKQFVYELGTLERIAQEISEFFRQIGFFTGYLSARSRTDSADWRKSRYVELCEQSHIKDALLVITKRLEK